MTRHLGFPLLSFGRERPELDSTFTRTTRGLKEKVQFQLLHLRIVTRPLVVPFDRENLSSFTYRPVPLSSSPKAIFILVYRSLSAPGLVHHVDTRRPTRYSSSCLSSTPYAL